ncbi:hypothetical protein D9757_013689 [Collybiopsis confluens]|uniref:Man(5)GlcNAc(2)-PP-dolichol translocation protein RFT1 n=1 Tax=Collybiopsis confluens TaxID=2823264 RepID=A0A8H5CMK2_9AGAR|nr:hypothetical protein D9757_013689 [Collybiopsis confluens]
MASSTASTLTSLMGLQLFTRLFTFVLNQALSRLASPAAFGIYHSLLEREGVRGALLRVESAGPDRASAPQSGDKTGTRNRNGSAAMNVGFIPFIIGVPLAIGTSLLYITTASKETRVQPNFYSAVLVYVLAAIMELLAEPMHNMAMSSVQTNVRVRAEGIGITAKTLTTFLILVYDANGGGGDLALLAFAFGQLMYGSLVFLVYLRRFGRAGLLTSLSKNSSGVYFDRDVLALSTTMTSQSLVKHFLTEGDKFILSWFSPLQDQGGYALAVNYGSLIARIVFQPIEETLRLYFSKTLAQVTSSSSSTSTTSSSSPNSHEPDQNPQRQPPHKNPHLPALLKSSRTLLTLLNIQLTTSLFILIFGTHYLPSS